MALVWGTFGEGDHMSQCNVNACGLKWLIKHLVRRVADTEVMVAAGRELLLHVLATEVSP